MLKKCSLRYRNLTNLKKIKQMDSFDILNVSHEASKSAQLGM